MAGSFTDNSVQEQRQDRAYDNDIGVVRVERRYNYSSELDGSVNTVINNQPGYVDHISVSAQGPIAVDAILRDSASLGSGTIVKTIYINVASGSVLNFDLPIHAIFSVGIEMDFANKSGAGNVRIQVFKR